MPKQKRRSKKKPSDSAGLRSTPRRTPPESVRAGAAERTVMDALSRLDEALACAETAVDDYQRAPAALFDLDELAEALNSMRRSQIRHMTALGDGLALALTDAPLAITYGTGEMWAGRQRPRYLRSMAERATADDGVITTYRDRLQDVTATASTIRICPRTTENGAGCNAIRVRLGDGTRARACWNHLTDPERAEIRAERDAAVTRAACPACRMPIGQPCRDEAGRPTQIHNRRLLYDRSAALSRNSRI